MQETRRKLRSAQASLMESEQERDRRMKLMRKTHKTTMANKQHLIEDLQDIIVDRDRVIRQLEGGGAEGVVNNKVSVSISILLLLSYLVQLSSCDPLHQLVQRISLLHSENSSLTGQYEEAMDRLQHALRDKERLEDELVVYRETPLTVSTLVCVCVCLCVCLSQWSTLSLTVATPQVPYGSAVQQATG